MINNVVLTGRITKDLELKYTSSNIPSVAFTLAVNRTRQSQDGKQQADYIGCIAYRKRAENMVRYLGKGSLIGVEGKIQTGSYTDTKGNTVYTTNVIANEVHFLESKKQGQQSQFNQNYNQSFNNNGYNQQGNYNQGYNNKNNGYNARQKPDAMNYIGQDQNRQNKANNRQDAFNDFGNNFPSDNEFNFEDIPNPFKEDY